jgi:hypothetical protein
MPETIAVTCNGLHGTFVVRTKTVVDKEFTEQRATDFVDRCGKSRLQWIRQLTIAAVGVRALSVCVCSLAMQSGRLSPPFSAWGKTPCGKARGAGLCRRMLASRCNSG